ncbi:acyltransferase family protein [Parachryseolinea silvisoli]|uniref:acyltransferase family protein n=1 Tax=Parachryseolinea silvisoli TaxID=2873601 RepID=UPI0022659B11|nr:acyltransferase [Parachryseolinea silvisoli]MCD9019791.1 acyltransferase [Parachryseolinea silvisoli]
MRLHNLDYLRGLAAIGIMLYHYMSGVFGDYESESFTGRLGVYGVSIFYVLSGLTLYYVYFKKMRPSRDDIQDFYLKRFFRIYPLLWVVIIATIVLSTKVPAVSKIFLNLTGLFGFVKWDAAIGRGVWSIGNELVFYAFFPFFIYFSKHRPVIFWIFSAALLAVYIYFAFYTLTPDQSLTSQWYDYTNPLNQVFLFLGGYLIGYLFSNTPVPNIVCALLVVAGLALFCFYPVEGDRIQLVTGYNRVVFTVACFFICFGFFKLQVEVPAILDKPLSVFGESSYSIYLLHPLVYNVCGKALGRVIEQPKGIGLMVGSIVITLILSYISYEKFEKFFMKKARAFARPA